MKAHRHGMRGKTQEKTSTEAKTSAAKKKGT